MPKGRFEQYRGQLSQNEFDNIISQTKAQPETIVMLTQFFVEGVRQKDITDKKQTFSNRLRWFLEKADMIEKLN